MAWIDIADYVKETFPALNYSSGLAPKAGVIYQYAGSVAPDGFLMCDGSAVSRTTYAELFSVIGTTYGTGNGSTTFNVPDLCGKVGIGSSDEYALGSVGGEKEHTLTVDEMPSHNHGLTIRYGASTGDYHWNPPVTSNTGTQDSTSTHSTGGSQPHNNMQPYLTINYIISTGQGALDAAEIIGGLSTLPLGIEYGGFGGTSAAVARQNLGMTNVVAEELLWTNASPSSAFAAQTISLSLSGYDKVEIEYRTGASTNVYDSKRVNIANNPTSETHVDLVYSDTVGLVSSANAMLRRRAIITSSNIKFESCFYRSGSNTSGGTSANYIIPQKIYGIRKVD